MVCNPRDLARVQMALPSRQIQPCVHVEGSTVVAFPLPLSRPWPLTYGLRCALPLTTEPHLGRISLNAM